MELRRGADRPDRKAWGRARSRAETRAAELKLPLVWPERKGRPHLSSGEILYGDFHLFATDAMQLGPDVVFTLN